MPDIFDFDANKVVESLDSVPEKYRGLYVEGDGDNAGKHVITSSVAGIVADYTGTHKALTKSRGDTKKSNDENGQRRIAVKAYDDLCETLGIETDSRNAEGLKTFLDDLTGKVKGGEALKIDLDKIRNDHTRRFDEAAVTHVAEMKAKDSALESHMINDAAVREIAASKGSVDLLLPHIRTQCKVVNDDGKFVVRVFDAEGNARSDGAGGWMSVGGLIAEMKASATFGRAFDSELPGGTGAKPGSTNKPSPGRSDKDMSSSEKIAKGLLDAKRTGKL